MKNAGKKPPAEPSVEMMDAVRRSGSLVIKCEFCGRIHFADSGDGGYEKGELEALEAKEKRSPDRYISHDDSVSWGPLDGKQAVVDCPCRALRRYEDFIWNNRRVIVEYLKARAREQLEEAQRDSKLVEGVAGQEAG